MKNVITILLCFVLGPCFGQEKKDTFYFERLKIIAMDTSHYIAPANREKRTYFVLGEIKDSNYDTLVFCRPRFVMCYYADVCDLVEGYTYKVAVKRDWMNPNKEKVHKNNDLILNSPPDEYSPCNDRIFYINYKVKFTITDINVIENEK